MENIKDSIRYYNWFVKDLQDYKDLSTIEFYQEYIDTNLETTIVNEWNVLDQETKDLYEDYEEYKEQYIEDNINEDEMEESIREYFDPLDITTYSSDNNENKIYEIQLCWWWPWADITINTRWWTWLYSFNWWGDSLERYVDKDLVEIYLWILWLDY